jgi:hypothetical protein
MDKPSTGQKFHLAKPVPAAAKNPAKTKRTGPVTRADALGEVSQSSCRRSFAMPAWPDLAVE